MTKQLNCLSQKTNTKTKYNSDDCYGTNLRFLVLPNSIKAHNSCNQTAKQDTFNY